MEKELKKIEEEKQKKLKKKKNQKIIILESVINHLKIVHKKSQKKKQI